MESSDTETREKSKEVPKLKQTRWTRDLERGVIEKWHSLGMFRFDPSRPGEIYSIDTPPPYISNKWHVGGAAHYSQIDMVARYKRLKGFNVLFPFGADRNGLPIEVMVERERNVSAKEMPRQEFLELCRQYLDVVEKEVLNQVRLLAMGVDLQSYYMTDSPEYRAITQSTFIDLFQQGLIYEDLRPVNWCPRCRTPMADADIEYRDLPSRLVYVRFKVKETGEDVIIATTRPELLASCAAVIYNPQDKRYQKLEGKTAIVPIYQKEVKIIPHNAAKIEFGTGIVMICSYGDFTDVRLFRELRLEPEIAIEGDGKMNEVSRELSGLAVEDARREIHRVLKDRSLVLKEQYALHRTPTCWRCATPVEIIEMKEFYLRQIEFRDMVRKMSDSMEFQPPFMKQILYNWIESISQDWPISRRRYYATEVPLWYCIKCRNQYVPPKGSYYQPWKSPPPQGSRCPVCGGGEFVGEERVLDTWMDSSISQLYIIGYMRDDLLFRKARPANLRPQGVDIVRNWLYYSILRNLLLLNDRPFRQVRISGMGVDEKGEVMHKSKGNVIYPEGPLEKYGADAFRLWAASEAKLGSNYRWSEERVKAASLFITKLWNVSRFVSQFAPAEEDEISENLDKLFVKATGAAIAQAEEGYESLDPFPAGTSVRDFLWNRIADHYLEMVKPRLYSQLGDRDSVSARAATHTILRMTLIALHPIMPVITDYIYGEIYGKSVMFESFPEKRPSLDEAERESLELITQFNSFIWSEKKNRGLSLNSALDETIFMNPKLAPFTKDLVAAHKLRNLKVGEIRRTEIGELAAYRA